MIQPQIYFSSLTTKGSITATPNYLSYTTLGGSQTLSVVASAAWSANDANGWTSSISPITGGAGATLVTVTMPKRLGGSAEGTIIFWLNGTNIECFVEYTQS